MRICVSLLIVIMLLGLAVPCFGDGKAFSGRDFSSMHPIIEGEQRALILHRDGIEKMLIAVSLELEDEDKALWIFPIPSEPNKVKIDMVDSFPSFLGWDTRGTAKNLLFDMTRISLTTQIYTTPFTLLTTTAAHFGGLPIIHHEVEKWGIHAETITAESMESFMNYLKNKNVGIADKELKAFEDYFSDKYVFVVVWISSRQQLLQEFPQYEQDERLTRERWPSLYVEFATDQAFYPLRPTSSYGRTKIPILLIVIGHVKPNIKSSLAEVFEVRHYTQEGAPKNTPAKLTKDLTDKKNRYTLISFSGPAGWLNEDLWFVPVKIRGIKYAEFLISALGNGYRFTVCAIFIILIVSYLSAGLAGLLLFRRWRPFAKLGLWNILTLAGLYFATRAAKERSGELLIEPKKRPGRKLFILCFSVFYLVLTSVATFILALPLSFT